MTGALQVESQKKRSLFSVGFHAEAAPNWALLGRRGLAGALRTHGGHILWECDFKKTRTAIQRETFVPNLTHTVRRENSKTAFFFFSSFYFERSMAKEGSHRGEPRLLTDVWLLADGRSDNKTIASEVTKAVPNNEGLTDEQWDFSLYFWSFCASLKNLLILMVSVSMVWPGLLAALILIVYCINMRKKNYSSDFDDDNRVFPLLPSRGVNRFSLLFFWWCFYFTCFFHAIFLSCPHFPISCYIAI